MWWTSSTIPEEILARIQRPITTPPRWRMSVTRIGCLTLRMKLDAAGYYDDFEVNRVVEVEFNPQAKQSESGCGTGAGRVTAFASLTRLAQNKLKTAKAKR
jgi:hypothetical protein